MHSLTILSFMISTAMISNGMLHMITIPYPERHQIFFITNLDYNALKKVLDIIPEGTNGILDSNGRFLFDQTKLADINERLKTLLDQNKIKNLVEDLGYDYLNPTYIKFKFEERETRNHMDS